MIKSEGIKRLITIVKRLKYPRTITRLLMLLQIRRECLFRDSLSRYLSAMFRGGQKGDRTTSRTLCTWKRNFADSRNSRGNTGDRDCVSAVKATDKCQPQERVGTEEEQREPRVKIPERRFRISLSDNWRISAAKSRNNEGSKRRENSLRTFSSFLSLCSPISPRFCRR